MKKKLYRKFLGLTLCAALITAMAAGCGSKKLTGTVTTDGSTSMEKVIGALGEAFESGSSGITFTYNPTGSGTGITAAAEGRCDIGLSSRSLKHEEKAKGLKETVLAYDGIAVIVNPENPVSDLTAEQMGDWAAAMGIEAVYIDKDTTIRQFKNELRWNAAAYRK